MSDCKCIVCDEISNKTITMNCIRYASVDKTGNRIAVMKDELGAIESNYKRVIDHIRDVKIELLTIVKANHKIMKSITEMQTEIKQLTTQNSKLTEQNSKLSVVRNDNQQLENRCKEYAFNLNKLQMQSNKEISLLTQKNSALFKRFRELKDRNDDDPVQIQPPPYHEPP